LKIRVAQREGDPCPPVVHKAVLYRVVIVGKELLQIVPGGVADVPPEDGGSIPVDQVVPVAELVPGVFIIDGAPFKVKARNVMNEFSVNERSSPLE
jgi:hypothetical protein